MPKRNLVWIAIGAVIAVLLWNVPESFIRRDALLNQFSPLLDVRLQILKNYVEPIDENVLLRGAIDGMLNRLDPYSDYFDADEYEQFQMKTEGQFEGIGIEVHSAPGGGLVIISPIEGSPAFYAGLRAGDQITEIDGDKTDNMARPVAIRKIQGKPGSAVTLTLFRPSNGEMFKRSITRGLITVRTIRGWARNEDWEWDYIIDDAQRIAYLRISSFEAHTAEHLDNAFKQLMTHHRLRGLILDVRDNPGGLLKVVVEVANRFISDGVIVSTKGRHTPEQPYIAARDGTYPDVPLVVLVNHGSASASEILAGALKDHRRATIVGEQTFGKGSVQDVIKLEGNRGAVKLTTAYYYLPNGERIHGRGITPDKIIDLRPDERTKLIESQLAVYSTSQTPTTTRASTTTAPARVEIDIRVDRQLQEALTILRRQLATQPSEN